MHRHTLLLLTFWFLGFQSCRPKAPEPDPCAGKSPVTADFHIYETFPGADSYPEGWELYDTDTPATGMITFTALEEDAEYEWTLGPDRIREKTFTKRNFPDNANIYVRLKIIKRPDLDCFPEDDGVDTKTRVFYTITIIDQYKDPTQGTFRGVNLDESDKYFNFEVESPYILELGGGRTSKQPLRIGFNNCDIPDYYSYNFAYKQLYFGYNVAYDCLSPRGILRVHDNNRDSVTIRYSIQKAPGSDYFDIREDKIFKGIRIK